MKRIILLLICFVLLLTVLFVSAAASEEECTFSLLANQAEVATTQVDSIVSVALLIQKNDGSDTIDIDMLQDYIYFDTEYLEYIDCVVESHNGSPLVSADLVMLARDYDRLFLSRLPGAPITVNNPCRLITVRFRTLKTGTTMVSHEASRLYKESDIRYSLSEKNAVINIVEKGSQASVFEVSGTAASFISDTDGTVIELWADGAADAVYTVAAYGKSAIYSIGNVLPGAYILKVSKANHASREYTVTVTDAAVTQNVDIFPLGDITGDGKLTAMDINKGTLKVKNKADLSDYESHCADIDGNGEISALDITKMTLHCKNKLLIW